MTTNEINRESEREERWNIVMAVVLAAVGLLMMIYSAANITGLICSWLAHLY